MKHMKAIMETLFSILLITVPILAHAQAPTLSLRNVTQVSGGDWKYNTVECTSPRNITSITLSMINNTIASNSSGITPAGVFNSSGFNPRTVTYVFTGISSADVKTFIEGITFRKTSEVAGANNHVRISVDANPTSLPAGATITVWENHPDGTPHYYLWVNTASYISYHAAYNAAKSYYFQGMRGYLPTITSVQENNLLENISEWSGGTVGTGSRLGGWSAGVRTTDMIADPTSIATTPLPAGREFKWIAGPEAGFAYCITSTVATEVGSMPLGSAYLGWEHIGFIQGLVRQPDGNLTGENCMQINYSGYWNDLPAELLPANNAFNISILSGYFIEFGGSGEAYSVNGANYPANPAYKKPITITTNAQWQGFSPGNTSSAATTIKARPLRVNVMVIE